MAYIFGKEANRCMNYLPIPPTNNLFIQNIRTQLNYIIIQTDIENIQCHSHAALGLGDIKNSRTSLPPNSREPSPAPVQRTESMALRAARAAKNWKVIFSRVNAVRNLTNPASKGKQNASNV